MRIYLQTYIRYLFLQVIVLLQALFPLFLYFNISFISSFSDNLIFIYWNFIYFIILPKANPAELNVIQYVGFSRLPLVHAARRHSEPPGQAGR